MFCTGFLKTELGIQNESENEQYLHTNMIKQTYNQFEQGLFELKENVLVYSFLSLHGKVLADSPFLHLRKVLVDSPLMHLRKVLVDYPFPNVKKVLVDASLKL